MIGLDRRAFRWVNALAVRTGWAHTVLSAYAGYGIVLMALMLCWGWWIARRGVGPTRVAGVLWAGVGALLALALNQPVAHLVKRPRPFVAMPGVEVLVHRAADFSFPSDHAVVAGAVTAGLVMVNRKVGTVAAVLAVALCFARVYVGVHYPGDVVAGAVLGAAIVTAGWTVARAILVPLVATVAAHPIGHLLVGAEPPPAPR